MDVQSVREGLAAAAGTIAGLQVYDFVPDAVDVPCFFPGEVTVDFDKTFGGDDELEVTCRILVAHGDDKDGQAALNAYLGRGPRSLKRALEGTPGVAQDLGGACDDIHVRRVQGYRMYEHGNDVFYGAELIVRVIGQPEQE